MIYRLEDLTDRSTLTEIDGKWVIARPINYKYESLRERFKAAWEVFRRRADAFYWSKGQ